MKITIDLPKWAEERDIFIMAGMELVAVKRAYSNDVYVKDVRCQKCGKCCEDVPENHFYEKGIDGHCIKLENGRCVEREYKPFACCVGEKTIKECLITYRKQ